MKTYTLTLFLFCIGNLAFSQPGWEFRMVTREPGRVTMDFISIDDWINSKTSFKYTGTPYVEDDFVYGSISDEDGNSRYAFLRYNAIEEIVEIKIPDAEVQEIQVLPRIENLSYTLNDYKYILDSFNTSDGEKIEGYIIEYYDGDSYGLYGNPLPKLAEAQRARTGYERDKPAHLSVEVDYYIQNEEGILQRVKLKDGDFKDLLPKSEEMNKYMAEHKLKTPQDYAGMLRWLDNQ